MRVPGATLRKVYALLVTDLDFLTTPPMVRRGLFFELPPTSSASVAVPARSDSSVRWAYRSTINRVFQLPMRWTTASGTP